MELEVLYEDKEILVCKKPAGVATQTKRFGMQDMESLIKNYRAKKKEPPYAGLVHRLDQPVSGIMVFGKTKEATAELSRQVKERTIGKHYYAVGQCEKSQVEKREETGMRLPKKGSLEDYIAFDKRTNVSRIVSKEEAKTCDGKRAYLDYQVVWEKECENSIYRLFDVKLGTGRHHQIRLQFANAGWPLAGDQKYNRPTPQKVGLALCSYKIAFVHPTTKQEMEFEMDCPDFDLGIQA